MTSKTIEVFPELDRGNPCSFEEKRIVCLVMTDLDFHHEKPIGTSAKKEIVQERRGFASFRLGNYLYSTLTGRIRQSDSEEETLDSVVIRIPKPAFYFPQHLCFDKGCDYPVIEMGVVGRKYIPHIRRRGENLNDIVRCHLPKRWVVERSAPWLNRFRKLLV